MSIWSAFQNLNWFAVLLAWILHVVISLVWYQPIFFGNAWVKLSGKEMTPAKRWIPVGFMAHLFAVISLAVIINLANATTSLEVILLSLLVSIGFIGAILAGELVWEKIPFRLFLIRVGDQIFTLGIAGVILSLWK
jgi:hypothetical protein